MFNKRKNEEFRLSKRELLSGGLIIAGLTPFSNKVVTPRQEAIILGNILGDGHLQLSPNQKTTRLRFTHSMKQRSYVDWEYQELGWLCDGVSPPKHIIEKNQYDTCRAYTAYKPELTKFHKLTYKPTNLPNRRFIKTIPDDFGKYLTNPETLMVWYLDDGTLRGDGGACRLATQSFTLPEHEILQDALQKNFNIKTVIEKWSRKDTSLYVPSRGGHAANFVSLFSDTIRNEIPSMAYKIKGHV